MRFKLIDAAKKEFPVQRLCKVLGVSPSGYFAWKERPACRRQCDDMVLLAHVRSAFALSGGTYGSPRMTYELRDNGLAIGRRRVARLMRENGLRARQKRRFQAHHRHPACLSDRAEPPGPGLYRNGPEPEVGCRHLLRLDPRGLAVSRHHHRPVRPAPHWLGGQRPPAQGTGIVGPAPGHCCAASCRRAHSPCGPRQPVLLPRLPG